MFIRLYIDNISKTSKYKAISIRLDKVVISKMRKKMKYVLNGKKYTLSSYNAFRLY
jgi:hypothetical protein